MGIVRILWNRAIGCKFLVSAARYRKGNLLARIPWIPVWYDFQAGEVRCMRQNVADQSLQKA